MCLQAWHIQPRKNNGYIQQVKFTIIIPFMEQNIKSGEGRSRMKELLNDSMTVNLNK